MYNNIFVHVCTYIYTHDDDGARYLTNVILCVPACFVHIFYREITVVFDHLIETVYLYA